MLTMLFLFLISNEVIDLGSFTSTVRCNNGKYVMWHTVVIPQEEYND